MLGKVLIQGLADVPAVWDCSHMEANDCTSCFGTHHPSPKLQMRALLFPQGSSSRLRSGYHICRRLII
jgi:hypothetical protein